MFKLLNDDIAVIDEKSPEDVFTKITRSVSDLIRISNSRFSIGIYGEWGTGKTTLMRMIERQLNSFLSEDAISLSWNKLVKYDSNEMTRLKEFLKTQYKVPWTEDSVVRYQKYSRTLTLHNPNVEKERSTSNPKKGKLVSALSFLFNTNRAKTTTSSEGETHAISIRYNEEKNEAILRVGNYTKALTAEKGSDGHITLHLKENEILSVWFDAWRYEREEQFALIAFMKTIAYTMADIPYYQDVKKILLRGIGIIGKDVLRHFATQYAMTNEGWNEMERKLLPQMDLLSKVDKDTIYFEGLQKIKEEMRKISHTHRIVIFIDDLDRCNAKKALEVFESTKAFLDIEGFIFIIGLSIDALYKIITKEYEGIEIKGEEYIRKIIQVYINLPVWNQIRIEKLIKQISEELQETNHELFTDTKLIASAANYNPREVKRIINRYTISSYLDEIDPTIFLIIQAFESRWYDNLYRHLDDRIYRDKIIGYIESLPPDIELDIRTKRPPEIKDRPLSEIERALVALDWSFWVFVQNRQYHDKIGGIIRNWEDYKEKYSQSAEPIEEIKMAQGGRTGRTFPADLGRDYSILEHNIIKELCEINQGEELAIDEIQSIRAFDRKYVEKFLRYFEKKFGYIEILPKGKIRLTDEGRNNCREYA